MKLVCPVSALIVLLGACSTQPATYSIETIDGVTYVHNTASIWGEESRISLEHELTIGGADATDEEFILQTPFDAMRDEKGNIYILDRWLPGVRVYNSDGEFLLDMGKKGSGPGELLEALSMDRSPAGEVYIVDPMGGKMAVFTPDGGPGKTLRPDRLFFNFRILSDGRMVSTRSDYSQDPPPVACQMNKSGSLIRWIGRGETHELDNVRSLMNSNFIEIDESDSIYLAFQFQNRIGIYSSEGDMLMRIDRPLAYPLEVGTRMAEYERDGEIISYVQPELTSVSRGIGIDHYGRIWSLTYSQQPVIDDEHPDAAVDPANLHFEVFQSSGVLLGYVPMPVMGNSFRIEGDRLLMADPRSNACVYVYRIIDME
jgi:hypothetical protein